MTGMSGNTTQQSANDVSVSQQPTSGRILPLLGDETNRKLLTRLIENRYEVVPPESVSIADSSFDLCIVDEESLEAHWQVLAETKAHRTAAFLPYLLVTHREARELPLKIQDVVDGVVTLPTTKAVLASQIVNLLKRRQSEERFRRLFQAAPDPVVVISDEGLVSAANKAFREQFDVDEKNLSQMFFADLPFSREETAWESNSEEEVIQVSWERDDDTTPLMELHISPLRLGGENVEWIAIFRDISAAVDKTKDLGQEQNRLNGLHWSRN